MIDDLVDIESADIAPAACAADIRATLAAAD